MRITCPQCQFQGLIDTGPLAFDTRVVCVQCGTTFEAQLVGGEIKTKLPSGAHENLPLQPIMPAPALEVAETVTPETVTEAEDVLVLPQTTLPSEHNGEPAAALEDVLSVNLADAGAAAEENSAACEPEDEFKESMVVFSDSRDASSDEEPSSDTAPDGDGRDFALSRPPVEAAVELEKHGLGMRLMRISPLWLLVCGTTFVSVIILCNQLVKPAEQEQRVAASYSVPDNRASNQSLTQPSVPTTNKASATSVQDSAQTAAPAPVELKSEAKAAEQSKAVEQNAEAQKQSEPQPEAAPKIVPAVETKSEAPAPPAQSQESGAGGFTIQVGSYNVIEQANERVASMRAAGFDARVVAVELPKRGTWYRVQAGRFGSREEAQRYGNDVKAKRAVDSFIVAEAEGGR